MIYFDINFNIIIHTFQNAVHAWACFRVYEISSVTQGRKDLDFLERCFHKLLVNWTWWVNRKDENGTNLFDGGFLGLDNIGIFDRSNLDEGWRLEQADATAWMGNYCLDMLRIALELALYQNPGLCNYVYVYVLLAVIFITIDLDKCVC
jgi:hypothetical protein